MECWLQPDPAQTSRNSQGIAKALQQQYERWQPRAKYKSHADPTVDDVKKLCREARRQAKVCTCRSFTSAQERLQPFIMELFVLVCRMKECYSTITAMESLSRQQMVKFGFSIVSLPSTFPSLSMISHRGWASQPYMSSIAHRLVWSWKACSRSIISTSSPMEEGIAMVSQCRQVLVMVIVGTDNLYKIKAPHPKQLCLQHAVLTSSCHWTQISVQIFSQHA